ncbi:hypothetical protein [Streptomyces sp. NBC_01789]|uniref:hypothetical protein n=1 Tax=Streptomyces sp. NBC_01789 TaxID=2975941 RepID=UPI002256C390|nr:hypothetical protein [Streptomyces sp. NBC_01789]MCX4449500.1 hypothetical protein [Streptomyces sp. NBC_01789]
MNTPEPPRRRSRTTVTVVAACAAVVVACAAVGYLALRDDGKDEAGPQPSPSASASASASAGGTDRGAGGGGSGPLVAGWKTVVNAKRGITFDVPASWARKSADWVSYVAENDDPKEKPLVAMMAPAILKEKWCTSDDDKDGTPDEYALASTGTTGEQGSRSAAEAAEDTAETWVYGLYTQPDRSRLTIGEPESFRTTSGVEGSLVTVTSSGNPKKGKCDTDGKAVTFAFKNAEGRFVSWTYVGAHGVPDEVSDATIRQILGTVRLFKEGDGGE